MRPEPIPLYEYPAESYSEVIPGLFQASAARTPAEMLSMFDVLIDVGGRDRWEGDPDPRYSFHPLDDVPFIVDAEMIHEVGERVAGLVEEGKQVAVNCLSGVNRSGLLAARALAPFLYAISPRDPLAIGATCAALLALVAAASYLPLRRATAVDPAEALRSE